MLILTKCWKWTNRKCWFMVIGMKKKQWGKTYDYLITTLGVKDRFPIVLKTILPTLEYFNIKITRADRRMKKKFAKLLDSYVVAEIIFYSLKKPQNIVLLRNRYNQIEEESFNQVHTLPKMQEHTLLKEESQTSSKKHDTIAEVQVGSHPLDIPDDSISETLLSYFSWS